MDNHAAVSSSAEQRAEVTTEDRGNPPPPDASGPVFVSHSSRNADAAMQIVAALESAGVPCWVAPRDITAGADWNQSIMSAINACRALLLIYSRHSVDSDPVKREVERAQNRHVPLIPVRIEDVPPSLALEFMISTFQWVDAYPPPVSRHLGAIIAGVKRALALPHALPRREDNAPPAYVRNYRILGKLGEGGMATVYKAEQREPMKRIVAIKLIKPGLDSNEVIARFNSERQALARMNHPNVAKVLDAGTDEAGRPFFVMEYVPGSPVTTFADDNKLTVRQRLELFIQICQAVAHAHAKALIHRDIKASNVLAYQADGTSCVKVIDFGIAKALTGDRLTDRTFNTEHGKAIGTYESMSPEQADGSPDIDTRTDVYALGVLLYEMLSGAEPFDRGTLAKVADNEVRRIIREVEPPRPSARLSSLGETRPTVAAARRASVESLTSQLRCELEWIPMKAMRKERDRRYASPLELASDIENYLQHRPLRAGPESIMYRLKKNLRRNRNVVITAAIFIILVGIGIGIYINMIRIAQKNLAAEQSKTLAALVEARSQRDEVERQRQVAARLLSTLKETAPTFYSRSQALMKERNFAEALKNVSYAADLAPENPEYQQCRANLLQSLYRFEEASGAYDAILSLRPDDAGARENREFCQQLIQEQKEKGQPQPRTLSQWQESMQHQKRFDEAMALMLRIQGNDRSRQEQVLRYNKLLADAGVHCGLNYSSEGRLTLSAADGERRDWSILRGIPIEFADLNYTKIDDLSPLAGMPLTYLKLSSPLITDLRPLKGMPLVEFYCSFTKVQDITPLSGMPLTILNLSSTQVSDLGPLRGAHLIELDVTGTLVKDLSPLHGMLLKRLGLSACAAVDDITPLEGMPLEYLKMSVPNLHDISALHGMKLKELDIGGSAVSDIHALKGMPLIKLRAGRTKILDFSPLRGMPLKELDIEGLEIGMQPVVGVLRDLAHLETLQLFGRDIDNVDALQVTRLKELRLGSDILTDLSALRATPIESLLLQCNNLSDLGPLEEMPRLTTLVIGGQCQKLRDLRPLLKCMKLESLSLSSKLGDIEILRTMPSLKYLGYDLGLEAAGKIPTAEEFWKQYDARKASGK